VDRFLFLTLNGLSRGAVYAAFALALVIIWRGTRQLNFAQGAFAVATSYLAYTVIDVTGSYWAGFAAALVGGLLFGAAAERLVMRRVQHSEPLTAVVVALGVVIVIQAGLGMIYGNDFRPLATPLPHDAFTVAGHPVLSPYDLFVFGAVGVIVVGLWLLFTRTSLGLRMRSAAFAPEVSQLLGVNVARMFTLGWSLAALAGALAGMLVIPTELGLHPTAMDLVFVTAFTAAVVGGLDSPLGAVVGGLLVGLALSYVGGYLGSGLPPLASLALLLGVLMVRPGGLFSTVRAREV
jgi:branched-chain amino acid transport system permease protein